MLESNVRADARKVGAGDGSESDDEKIKKWDTNSRALAAIGSSRVCHAVDLAPANSSRAGGGDAHGCCSRQGRGGDGRWLRANEKCTKQKKGEGENKGGNKLGEH